MQVVTAKTCPLPSDCVYPKGDYLHVLDFVGGGMGGTHLAGDCVPWMHTTAFRSNPLVAF